MAVQLSWFFGIMLVLALAEWGIETLIARRSKQKRRDSLGLPD